MNKMNGIKRMVTPKLALTLVGLWLTNIHMWAETTPSGLSAICIPLRQTDGWLLVLDNASIRPVAFNSVLLIPHENGEERLSPKYQWREHPESVAPGEAIVIAESSKAMTGGVRNIPAKLVIGSNGSEIELVVRLVQWRGAILKTEPSR